MLTTEISHVRSVFRVVFVSSHFILQIANVVHGSRSPLRWVTVADPKQTTEFELPAEMVSGLNLPRHENLLSRAVVEKREVLLSFESRHRAVEYATTILGLQLSDEATAADVAPSESALGRLLSVFRAKIVK